MLIVPNTYNQKPLLSIPAAMLKLDREAQRILYNEVLDSLSNGATMHLTNPVVGLQAGHMYNADRTVYTRIPLEVVDMLLADKMVRKMGHVIVLRNRVV